MSVLKIRDTYLWYILSKNKYLRKILSIKILRYTFDLFLPSESYQGIPINIGVVDFFKKLKEQKINYVVLRNFENLPNHHFDSDIDFLVADYDYIKFLKLITRKPSKGLIPIDINIVYTSKEKIIGLPLYQQQIGFDLLNSSYFNEKGIKIPKHPLYFWSYLYHTVISKGLKSKIQSTVLKTTTVLEKDRQNKYLSKLQQLSTSIETVPEITSNTTLECLFSILEKSLYLPNQDTLFKLSHKNLWLESFLVAREKIGSINLPIGLIIFFVRSANFDQVNNIKEVIQKFTKNDSLFFNLDKSQIDICLKKIRGSNWSDLDGGLPSHIIITKMRIKNDSDYIITAKNIKEFLRSKKKFSRTLLCKTSQVVHSSDNNLLAFHYLKILKFNENKIRKFISILNSEK